MYDVRDDEIEPGVLVNPRIVESTGRQREVEGCLSIPGLDEVVERSDRIVVEGLNREGEFVRVEARANSTTSSASLAPRTLTESTVTARSSPARR